MSDRTAVYVLIGTAIAQIVLTIAFMLCYFWVLREFMQGRVRVPSGYGEMFAALLGVITGNLGSIVTFWFLRQRPQAANGG